MLPEYIGNGAYCYANVVSMMLKYEEEDISPALIEVLSGVGLGAFWDDKIKLILFSNFVTFPDTGINNSLNQLGFNFKEYVQESPKNPPLNEVKQHLQKSLVVVGPIDINYLTTWGISDEIGSDHFVLVYKITDEAVWIHDPQKYPSLAIPHKEFEQIWRADNISYRKGYYHYWTQPKRIKNYSQDQIYNNALKLFKSLYEKSKNHPDNIQIDEEATRACASFVKNGPKNLSGHLLKFCFPLGARRALDYAFFFSKHNKKLANIKEKQSEIFSRCQVAGMKDEWQTVSLYLEELAQLEKNLRDILFSL